MIRGAGVFGAVSGMGLPGFGWFLHGYLMNGVVLGK